jgi:urate oxidase
MTKLIDQRYGKARVRVMKVLREGAVHTLKDINVTALLQGDFASSYTSGDNTKVVATDTIKNTVNVFAKQHLAHEIEPFTITLGQHFVALSTQVEKRRSKSVNGSGNGCQWMERHPHSFASGSEARMFTRVICSGNSAVVASGIRDLVILSIHGLWIQGIRRRTHHVSRDHRSYPGTF